MKTFLYLLFPFILFSNNLSKKKDYIEPEVVLIKAGTFYFGSDNGDLDERPKQKVKINKSFYMAKYEVTFEEFDKYCEDVGRLKPKDNGWGRGKKPVIYVSYEDAKSYAKWLSEKTSKRYRLPTELEWEYAAKKATVDYKYHFEMNSNLLKKYAWFDKNSFDLGEKNKYFGPQIVGQKLPNENGLYDMYGNVWEWVDTQYTLNHKSNIIDKDYIVLKGGCWASEFKYLRSSEREFEYRDYTSASDGFRLVLELD